MAFYSPSSQSAQYTLYGAEVASRIQVTTAAADKALGTVVLPAALFGTVKAAFLDVEMEILNTAGALNYTESIQNIEATDGVTPLNAIVMAANVLYQGNDALRVYAIIRGNVDIKSIAVAGATITVTWKGADMHANGYDIAKIRPSIRFVTG